MEGSLPNTNRQFKMVIRMDKNSLNNTLIEVLNQHLFVKILLTDPDEVTYVCTPQRQIVPLIVTQN